MTGPDRITYARLVWAEWCRRRGDNGLELMSPAEWFTLTKWMDADVPLRIVLRGMSDCAGKLRPDTRLTYVVSSVEEAVKQWRRAVA